jgi:hypothetical protein
MTTCIPAFMIWPSMIVGPMSTLIGPTLGGTNVKAGGWRLGDAGAADMVAALAPAAVLATARSPAAEATAGNARKHFGCDI